MIRRLLVLLLVAAGVPALMSGPAHAATPLASFSGTITAADGQPLTSSVIVTVYSWFPPGDSAYPTPQASQLIPAGSDPHFTIKPEGIGPGYYSVRVAALGSGNPYLTTWLGGTESIATSSTSAGVVFLNENLTPLTGLDISMRMGPRVSGTVRGANGQPVADATVEAYRPTGSGGTEPIPSTPGSITDANGRYAITVAPGTQVQLRVSNRVGYAPWTSTGDTAVNADTTRDITLTPDWSGSGSSGAVVQDERCLQHAGAGTAVLPHRRLDVSTYGAITRDDTEWDNTADPFTSDTIDPALVPLWMGVTRPVTWGVTGSQLCAIWRSTFQDGTVFQTIVDDTGDGLDVVYNYGAVGASQYTATPQAGWLDSDGSTKYPESDGDTVQDLPSQSLGSAVAGRFAFHTDFVFRPPPTRLPKLTSPAVVGQPLTADPGAWRIPAGSTPEFRYVWKRDGEEIPTAGTSSYVPRRTDVGHDLSVMVTLLEGPSWDEGFDEDTSAERVAPATSTVRLTGPHRVRKGTRARVHVVVQMPGLVPEGTVTITDRGVPIATKVLGSDGRASIRLPRLPRGRHQLVASYSGDSTTQPATSSVVRLRVVRR